ncbi:unnamed protein product, partial [Polarella glacialis]
QPCVLLAGTSACLLWKPPGWAVTVGQDRLGLPVGASSEPQERGRKESWAGGDEDGEEEEESGQFTLQSWVQANLGSSGSPIFQDASAQHGLLHRLDVQSSGVVACAMTYAAYYSGKLEFSLRRTRKFYVCLCRGHFPLVGPDGLQLASPLKLVRAGPDGPKRSVPDPAGLSACTEVVRVSNFEGDQGEPLSLVEVRLLTGRLHQIRAHFSGQGFPLLGDELYAPASGPASTTWCPRIFLHSWSLGLQICGETLQVDCPLPQDLRSTLAALTPCSQEARSVQQHWLAGPTSTSSASSPEEYEGSGY